MADPPRYPGTGNDAGVGPDRGSPPRMPRWVKWPAIVIGVLILLFVILHIAGVGGEHGPGRHISREAAPSVGVMQQYTPPEDGSGGHNSSERGWRS